MIKQTLNVAPSLNQSLNEPSILEQVLNTGGGGTKDHSKLQNLDYEHAGHTGFQQADFFVTLTNEDDTITADKTISEIIEAYNQGKDILGEYLDEELGVNVLLKISFIYPSDSYPLVELSSILDSGDDFNSISLLGNINNNNDTWALLMRSLATSEDLSNYATKSDITVEMQGETYTTSQSFVNALIQELGGAFNDIYESISSCATKSDITVTFNDGDQSYTWTTSQDMFNYIVEGVGGAIQEIFSLLDGKQTKSNMDQTVDNNSTNYRYPSSQAVYEYGNIVVDLGAYNVGDTISGDNIVAKLKDERCIISKNDTWYRRAAIYGTGYVFTTMNGTDHGQWITLNYSSQNNNFSFLELGTASWEQPSNKVQDFTAPTTNTYPSTLAVYNYVEPTKTNVTTIQGLIPNQATTSNQLADKNFVNSSVQTATANFRGNWSNWASIPTDPSLYPADYAGSTTPTVNDYLVVQDASDYTGSTLEGTWRYKYSGTWSTDGKAGWLPEYQVNETPMTAAQLAAINSGITQNKVDNMILNTDYADATTGDAGIIKAGASYGTTVSNTGYLGGTTLTAAQYGNVGNGALIGKGTLENVLTDKGYLTSSNVDSSFNASSTNPLRNSTLYEGVIGTEVIFTIPMTSWTNPSGNNFYNTVAIVTLPNDTFTDNCSMELLNYEGFNFYAKHGFVLYGYEVSSQRIWITAHNKPNANLTLRMRVCNYE